MPNSKEDKERQDHEKEVQLKGIFLKVVVSPNFNEQADPSPPEKKHNLNL